MRTKKKVVSQRPRSFVLVDAGPLYLDLQAEARRRGLTATGFLRQILFRELRENNAPRDNPP